MDVQLEMSNLIQLQDPDQAIPMNTGERHCFTQCMTCLHRIAGTALITNNLVTVEIALSITYFV